MIIFGSDIVDIILFFSIGSAIAWGVIYYFSTRSERKNSYLYHIFIYKNEPNISYNTQRPLSEMRVQELPRIGDSISYSLINDIGVDTGIKKIGRVVNILPTSYGEYSVIVLVEEL